MQSTNGKKKKSLKQPGEFFGLEAEQRAFWLFKLFLCLSAQSLKLSMTWFPFPALPSSPTWFRWPRYHAEYIVEIYFSVHLKNEKSWLYFFFHFQLVCEEVNVDRFYPVLYPKVGSSTLLRLSQLLLSPPTPHPLPKKFCKLSILSSSGIKARCHLWWARDQQQLQVWSHLSKVWPGECASEIPLLIFLFFFCFWSHVSLLLKNVLCFSLHADIRGGALWKHGRKSCLCWVPGVSGPQDWASRL